jgi:hypothetical protein
MEGIGASQFQVLATLPKRLAETRGRRALQVRLDVGKGEAQSPQLTDAGKPVQVFGSVNPVVARCPRSGREEAVLLIVPNGGGFELELFRDVFDLHSVLSGFVRQRSRACGGVAMSVRRKPVEVRYRR